MCVCVCVCVCVCGCLHVSMDLCMHIYIHQIHVYVCVHVCTRHQDLVRTVYPRSLISPISGSKALRNETECDTPVTTMSLNATPQLLEKQLRSRIVPWQQGD